jgi:hypothetical protein
LADRLRFIRAVDAVKHAAKIHGTRAERIFHGETGFEGGVAKWQQWRRENRTGWRANIAAKG